MVCLSFYESVVYACVRVCVRACGRVGVRMYGIRLATAAAGRPSPSNPHGVSVSKLLVDRP